MVNKKKMFEKGDGHTGGAGAAPQGNCYDAGSGGRVPLSKTPRGLEQGGPGGHDAKPGGK